MTHPIKALCAALLGIALLVSVTACQKQDGPVEKAGKTVDSAIDKAGQQIEKAGDEMQDAAKGEKK